MVLDAVPADSDLAVAHRTSPGYSRDEEMMIDVQHEDALATAAILEVPGPEVTHAEHSDELADVLLDVDVLVEDVSIDGMCGVY